MKKGQKESNRNRMPNVPTCSASFSPPDLQTYISQEAASLSCGCFCRTSRKFTGTKLSSPPSSQHLHSKPVSDKPFAPSKQYRRRFVLVASCFFSLGSGFQVAACWCNIQKDSQRPTARPYTDLHSTWGMHVLNNSHLCRSETLDEQHFRQYQPMGYGIGAASHRGSKPAA